MSLEFDKPVAMGDGGFYVGVDDYTGEARLEQLVESVAVQTGSKEDL